MAESAIAPTGETGCARCAIHATMARYNVAGDKGRLEALAATFAPDGVLDTGFWRVSGRIAIVEKLGETVAAPDPRLRKVRHHLTTSEVTLETETAARALSYFIVSTNEGLDHMGTYADEFALIEGEWLITSRSMRLDWVSKDTLMVPTR